MTLNISSAQFFPAQALHILFPVYLLLADIDVKAASKFLGSRFACGASVTGDDEIVIQGDFVDDLFDVLPDKWSQVRLTYYVQVLKSM